MNKKWTLLLIVALLIVPLVLTACGGDDDKDDKKADDIKLSDTLGDETTGVTAQLPEGWVGNAEVGMLTMANSQAALDSNEMTGDNMGIAIMVQPLEMLGATDLTAAFETFTGFMDISETVTTGEVTDVKVGGKDAKRMNVSDSKDSSEGVLFAFLSEDNSQLVIVAGAAAKGNGGKVEPYARKVADSVKVAAVEG